MIRIAAVVLAAVTLMTVSSARAQQAEKIARIAVVSAAAAGGSYVDAFRAGMRELGYVEGRTVTIDSRLDDGASLSELATQLVRTQPDVIVVGGPDRIRAIQRATGTIPIVMAITHEPVAFGFAASLARPGGIITGLAFQDTELTTKRLELLRAARPGMARVAAFWNPVSGGESNLRSAEGAAKALGLTVQPFEVRESKDLAAAFVAAKEARSDAVLQLAASFLSYGPDFPDMYRGAAADVDRILKGAKPADLPIEQVSEFVLVINVKTAKMGIRLPESLRQRADRLIE